MSLTSDKGCRKIRVSDCTNSTVLDQIQLTDDKEKNVCPYTIEIVCLQMQY